MIGTALCLLLFDVKSTAQSGRFRTLIHPESVSEVHVTALMAIPRWLKVLQPNWPSAPKVVSFALGATMMNTRDYSTRF